MNTNNYLSDDNVNSKNKANEQLNIIPTPKEIELNPGGKVIFSKEIEQFI